MAWQFEQVQGVLQRLWPWAKGSFERPLLVFAAKDERSMRTLAPEYWERRGGIQPTSVFVTAADAHFISVRADVRMEGVEVNPYRSSYWSYVALTLTSSIPHELPLWYYRGVAEVFSSSHSRGRWCPRAGQQRRRPPPSVRERWRSRHSTLTPSSGSCASCGPGRGDWSRPGSSGVVLLGRGIGHRFKLGGQLVDVSLRHQVAQLLGGDGIGDP